MATGGGAPCFFDNMNAMNHAGKTIFLDVPATTIAERLQATDLMQRPLFARLSSEQLKDKIEFLRSQRLPFYKQAQLTFLQAEITADYIVSNIKA